MGGGAPRTAVSFYSAKLCKYNRQKLIVTKFQKRNIFDRTAFSKETPKWIKICSPPVSNRVKSVNNDFQYLSPLCKNGPIMYFEIIQNNIG